MPAQTPYGSPGLARQIVQVAAAVLTLLASTCAPSPAPAPQTASPANGRAESRASDSDYWDALFLAGSHVGFAHTRETIEPSGGTRLWRIESQQELQLKRFDQLVTLRIRLASWESEDGQLARFESTTEAGPSPLRVAGRVQGDQLIVTATTSGKNETTRLEWSPQCRGFFGTEQSLRAAPLDAGESRTLRVLWPGLTGVQLADEQLAAIDWEETDLVDRRAQLLKVRSRLRLGDQEIEAFYWTDRQGVILKSALPAMGQVTYHRVGRETALISGAPAQFDLGVDSVVRIAAPIPNPHASRRAVYRVRLRRADPAKVFASCLSQTVTRRDEHTADIEVRAVRPTQPATVNATAVHPPQPADRDPGPLVQSNDPRVRALADEVLPGETDPWLVAVALERHVHEVIRVRDFSQAFATAADVAESRQGDCTEHAVLLAALCRARQIPARVAMGLVYARSQQGFAFHMWNEVWIRDRWIPLDATLGLGGIGAAHLKIGDSSLAAGTAEAAVLPVVQVLGQMELEVLKVE